MQEIYRAPIDPELIAQRIQEIKDRASSSPPRSRRSACATTTSSRSRPASTSSSSRARSSPPSTSRRRGAPAAEPQGVHPRGPAAGRRRRLRELPHGAAPDAHRRGRRARRRRPRRGVHDPRGARHRRPAGDGDRGRRRRPLAEHARDRRVLPGHRRRRDAQRRRRLQGDRLRRRRGDDRLPLARAYEAPGRGYHWGMATFHPTLPRGARVKTLQTARSRRSSPVPRTRTTARSTCGRPAHVDGDLRLQGHRGVQPRRADDRARPADRGQAAAGGAGHRHGRAWLGRGAPTEPANGNGVHKETASQPTHDGRRCDLRHRRHGAHREDVREVQAPRASTRSSCSTTAGSTRS